MSARRIVVTSGKGGVGKTTTTANLGAALAQRGHRVVLVDADIGLRNLDLVLGVEKRIVFDLVEVVEGRCQLRQALIKDKRFESLAMLPAAQTRDKGAVSELQMTAVIDELAEMCDYLLIDCPAGIEHGFRTAIAGAREAIVVTTPEVSAIRDADRVIGKLHERGLPLRLIVNRVRPEMIKSGDMMTTDDVCEILSADLLGIVPDDEEIIDTTNRGEPIVLDPASRLGSVYDKIARRLEGEIVPFTQFEAPGFFGRLMTFWEGRLMIQHDVSGAPAAPPALQPLGRAIVVTSGKGGVGKTTTTANVGAALALRGARVALVDADVGLRNLDIVMGLESRVRHHVLDVLEERVSLDDALVRDKRIENLSLLAAAQTREKDEIDTEKMIALVNALREKFDYVLVDCPAGIEHGFRNAVAGAGEAIVVCTPEVSAVRDADRVVGLLGSMRAQLVINRLRPSLVRRGKMLSVEDVDAILRLPLLGVIADEPGVIVTTNRGEPIALDAASKTGAAYRAIAARLAGDDSVPVQIPQEPTMLAAWAHSSGVGHKTMMDFFKNWFRRETSGATAKERLRLVLLSDHLSLAPDVVENLRRDLIAVISKYVEVDEAHCDVTFEQQDSAVAMLANIPILKMKEPPRGGGPGVRAAAPPEPPTPPTPPPSTPVPAAGLYAEALVIEEPAPGPAPDGERHTVNAEAGPIALPAKRRRRRRRPAAVVPTSSLATPATG